MATILVSDRMSFAIDYFEDTLEANVDDTGRFLNKTGSVSHHVISASRRHSECKHDVMFLFLGC